MDDTAFGMLPDKVQRLYSTLPRMECKGMCQASCGPIPVLGAEARRIESKYGRLPMFDAVSLQCSELQGGRCSIYPDRPLICRLWGMVPKMACPWGCVPEGGYMVDIEARILLDHVENMP